MYSLLASASASRRASASSSRRTSSDLICPRESKSRPVATRAPSTAVSDGLEGRGVALALRLAGAQDGVDAPVGGGDERHPLALALDDHARRHRLHPARRELRHDLLPQHGADLVAVEPVEDAAGLLRVDEVLVEVARVRGGGLDGRLGDLVEHHAPDGDLRLQRLEQVPGDGLALAVAVRREVELVDLLEGVLELGDRGLLVGRDDVERLEGVVDVDPEARPALALVLGGHVGGAARQVADVAAAGLHDVGGAQVVGDLAGLRGRLDDHEPAQAVAGRRRGAVPVLAAAAGALRPVGLARAGRAAPWRRGGLLRRCLVDRRGPSGRRPWLRSVSSSTSWNRPLPYPLPPVMPRLVASRCPVLGCPTRRQCASPRRSCHRERVMPRCRSRVHPASTVRSVQVTAGPRPRSAEITPARHPPRGSVAGLRRARPDGAVGAARRSRPRGRPHPRPGWRRGPHADTP